MLTLDVTFALNGALYGNNSIVTITDIGEDVHSALLCVTNNINCCESDDSSGVWSLPNGTSANINGLSFYQNEGSSVLRLFRRSNSISPSGIFQCQIPDENGAQTYIYIGVFSSNAGE